MADVVTPVKDSDILSEDFINDPYPYYVRLRQSEPVKFVSSLNAWLLTRAKDVELAFADDRFVLSYENVQTNRLGSKALDQDFVRLGKEFLALTDPPEHSSLRKIFRAPFTTRRVRELAPQTEKHAHECIDRYFTSSPTDIVPGYAARVPSLVIGSLLSIPPEDHDRILTWVTLFQEAFFATPMSDEYLATINQMARDAQQYFLDLVRERRAHPGEDFVSGVIAANDADETPMSEFQLAANIFLLYFAGFDTQKQTFTNMVAMLDQHPDQLRYLVEDTSRIPGAMHELYRYDTASHVLFRLAAEDVELSGQTIKAGDSVLICPAAGCRDPEVYDDPESLDLRRPERNDATRYMIFGNGRHRCLGSALAMSNLPIMLKVLLERLPNLKVDRPRAVLHRSFGSRGYDALPVTWG